MPRISKSARSIRGGFVKFYRAINSAIGKFARAVRERWRVLTVTILGICVPVYAMAWYLDVNNNLAAKIAITGIVTAMPIIYLFSPSERLTFKNHAVWISIFSWLALVLFLGEEYGWRSLSFSVILVLLALPYGWFFWQIARYEWLLYVALLLALLATMIYWIAALAINEEGFDLLLLPLPFILSAGVVWSFIASRTLKSARRHKNRRVSGPGMQALAMTMLFFPITLVAITIPTGLSLNATWLNVSLALIGIFLSGVVSEPVRRFFVEWANLARYKK